MDGMDVFSPASYSDTATSEQILLPFVGWVDTVGKYREKRRLVKERSTESCGHTYARQHRCRQILKSLLGCLGKGTRVHSEADVNDAVVGTVSHDDVHPKISGRYLLPTIKEADVHKKCLVIDLDETLVHSTFEPTKHDDFVVNVEANGKSYPVYVSKRPHAEEFLQKMSELFECVVFTASLPKYADSVIDHLDQSGSLSYRLFRDSCVLHNGSWVKDLSRLGRDLGQVAIIDNSPVCYIFHPQNAIPVTSWFGDRSDTQLVDLIPLLESLAKADNVYSVLKDTYTKQPDACQRKGPLLKSSRTVNCSLDLTPCGV